MFVGCWRPVAGRGVVGWSLAGSQDGAAAFWRGGAGRWVILGPLVPEFRVGGITGQRGGLAAAALRWGGEGRHRCPSGLVVVQVRSAVLGWVGGSIWDRVSPIAKIRILSVREGPNFTASKPNRRGSRGEVSEGISTHGGTCTAHRHPIKGTRVSFCFE